MLLYFYQRWYSFSCLFFCTVRIMTLYVYSEARTNFLLASIQRNNNNNIILYPATGRVIVITILLSTRSPYSLWPTRVVSRKHEITIIYDVHLRYVSFIGKTIGTYTMTTSQNMRFRVVYVYRSKKKTPKSSFILFPTNVFLISSVYNEFEYIIS